MGPSSKRLGGVLVPQHPRIAHRCCCAPQVTKRLAVSFSVRKRVLGSKSLAFKRNPPGVAGFKGELGRGE